MTIDYYRISSSLKCGKKPKYLSTNKKATRKDQAKFEVYEKRLENFPLTKARIYQKEINELGISIREYSKKIGVSAPMICRYLKLLKLPREVIEFLDSNKTPKILRKCSVRFLNNLSVNTDCHTKMIEEIKSLSL